MLLNFTNRDSFAIGLDMIILVLLVSIMQNVNMLAQKSLETNHKTPILTVEEYKEAMAEAFFSNQYEKAQAISRQALADYPDVPLIQNLAKDFDRPLVASRPSSEVERQKSLASQKWIKTHLNEYRGRWIALSGDELIYDANSLNELMDYLEKFQIDNVLITVLY